MPAQIKNSPATIRKISAEDTLTIRSKVLRPGKPLQDCIFKGDELSSTFHLGAHLQDELVGVASYMANKNELFETPRQYQLRGMAVLPAFQKKKLGELLLLEGEKHLKKDQTAGLLWYNARTTAVEFYERYGYKKKGEPFMIPNVCMHVVMFKEL